MSAAIALRRWYDGLFADNAWTNVYALGRSLIALGPLLTLLFNPSWLLFAPLAGGAWPYCDGIVGAVGLFCLTPSVPAAHALAAVVLLLVVVGWRPRWTAVPHAWVAFSLHNSISLVEGGDQIAANLALLLLPVALMDGRRWHWSLPGVGNHGLGGGPSGRMIANTMLVLVRVQVCVIYLHAAVGKFGVAQWLDGTAVYYWIADPTFGASGVRGQLADLIAGTAVGVTVLTWGSLLLELALVFGLVASDPVRRALFWGGLTLHLSIAVFLGLTSFGIVMAGALLLYLWPRATAPTFATRAFARVARLSRRCSAYVSNRRRAGIQHGTGTST